MHDGAVPVVVQISLQSMSLTDFHNALARLVAFAPICESMETFKETMCGLDTQVHKRVLHPTVGLKLYRRIDKIIVFVKTTTIEQSHQAVSIEAGRHAA
jgi:hypothetical protein